MTRHRMDWADIGKYLLVYALMALLIAPFCIWGAHPA